MTLVDTSVWIDFFAGRELPHVLLLESIIDSNDQLALCGLILTEILQGIRTDAAYERTRLRLQPLVLLPMDEAIFVQGADIYRSLRKRGVTIRRTNDCLIAAVALTYGTPLLHADADFERIGRAYPLASAHRSVT